MELPQNHTELSRCFKIHPMKITIKFLANDIARWHSQLIGSDFFLRGMGLEEMAEIQANLA